jgi:hypothetical protein
MAAFIEELEILPLPKRVLLPVDGQFSVCIAEANRGMNDFTMIFTE